MRKEKFDVKGMSCSACSSRVEQVVKKINGIENVTVNLLTNNMVVSFDDNKVDVKTICDVVNKSGYEATLYKQDKTAGIEKNIKKDNRDDIEASNFKTEVNEMKIRLVFSVGCLIILEFFAMFPMIFPSLEISKFFMTKPLTNVLLQGLILIPIVFVNRNYFLKGIPSFFKGSANMDTLVSVGAGSSILYGIYVIFSMAYGFETQNIELVRKYSDDIYLESAAMILTLVTVGKFLESKSKAKTSNSIKSLIDIVPKKASLLKNDDIILVDVEELKVGDIIVVKSGESIPIDGVIIDGESIVDQSALTGESIPVSKTSGDKVISASLNLNGFLKIRCEKVGSDSTINQMIQLVEEASSSKAPIAKLADKISGVFVPVVMMISFVTALLWFVFTKDFSLALTRGISVLVISCPCALGLATPVAIMVGTGKAARLGILIKSGEAFQNVTKADVIVLDKTGTITKGEPIVTDIELKKGIDENDKYQMLQAIYQIEKVSKHPLAKAISDFCFQQLSLNNSLNNDLKDENSSNLVEDYKNVFGKGVKAKYKGNQYLVGNKALMLDEKVIFIEEDKLVISSKNFNEAGKSVIFVAVNKKIECVLAALDIEKENSKTAIKDLKNMGLTPIMLTGDSEGSAKELAKRVGIDEVVSEVLPQEKENVIRNLQKNSKKVIMVGDGINDSPALARADIGMAIGAGSDIAIDSADIILMNNSLLDVVTSIRLSKLVIKNIKQNLFWAFFYNIIGIPIAAGLFLYVIPLGIKMSPSIGALAMSFSSVFVVTNALRINNFKRKDKDMNKELQYELKIFGMSCMHCQSNAQEALLNIDGVKDASVDLDSKIAKVISDKEISQEVFNNVLSEAGYNLGDFKKI